MKLFRLKKVIQDLPCNCNDLWILERWVEDFTDGWFHCRKCGTRTWFFENEVEQC